MLQVTCVRVEACCATEARSVLAFPPCPLTNHPFFSTIACACALRRKNRLKDAAKREVYGFAVNTHDYRRKSGMSLNELSCCCHSGDNRNAFQFIGDGDRERNRERDWNRERLLDFRATQPVCILTALER